MFARAFCDVFALSESMQLYFTQTHTRSTHPIQHRQSAQHQTLFAQTAIPFRLIIAGKSIETRSFATNLVLSLVTPL